MEKDGTENIEMVYILQGPPQPWAKDFCRISGLAAFLHLEVDMQVITWPSWMCTSSGATTVTAPCWAIEGFITTSPGAMSQICLKWAWLTPVREWSVLSVPFPFFWFSSNNVSSVSSTDKASFWACVDPCNEPSWLIGWVLLTSIRFVGNFVESTSVCLNKETYN